MWHKGLTFSHLINSILNSFVGFKENISQICHDFSMLYTVS